MEKKEKISPIVESEKKYKLCDFKKENNMKK